MDRMEQLPAPTPEALLIQRKRKNLRLAVTTASAKAGISESRWRQIEKGFVAVKPDVVVTAVPPAETLASMAFAVGATPSELEKVGRGDAAEILAPRIQPLRQLKLKDVPTKKLISDVELLLSELGRRADAAKPEADSPGPAPDYQPLRRVAREVDPNDRTVFGGED